jgi:hypothetical protein
MLKTMARFFFSATNERSNEGTSTGYVMKVDADSFISSEQRSCDLSTSLCQAQSVCHFQTQTVRTHNSIPYRREGCVESSLRL